MSFSCPKCQSYMFGSSFENGITTYHCHGNEEWSCNFSCSEEYFNEHFSERYIMGHLTEQFFAETGDKAMYRKGGADYHTLRYVKWLEAKVEKFTSTNTGSPKLLNSLQSALPLVKNGMSSEEIHNVRGVIADAIDQLRASA